MRGKKRVFVTYQEGKGSSKHKTIRETKGRKKTGPWTIYKC